MDMRSVWLRKPREDFHHRMREYDPTKVDPHQMDAVIVSNEAEEEGGGSVCACVLWLSSILVSLTAACAGLCFVLRP